MEAQNIVTTRKLVLGASIAAIFGGIGAPTQADSYDVLLEKLRAKGVISDSEYGEFRMLRADEVNAAEESGNKDAKMVHRDGFTLESADGENSLSIEGRIHADFRSFSEDGAGSSAADTFDIRRAYLGVKGKIAKDWSFEATQDIANNSLEYAYINYKASDAAQLRIGAFKFQFSFEEITSSRFVDFQERSFVNALVPGKDQGIMIHGEPVKNTFAYAVGVMNGSGKNTDEASAVNDDKEIVGRVAANFAPMMNLADTVLHLGLNYSDGTTNNAGTSIRTESRGLTTFNIGTGAPLDGVDRTRAGIEGVLAYGPVKLQSEWVKMGLKTAAYDRDIDAMYVAANWLITGENYDDNYTLGGMKAIKPNDPFKNGGDGWGAWELGLRYSKLDGSDWTNSAELAAGTTAEADAITVGLKWIPVTPVRVYLNYSQTDFSSPVATATGASNDEKALTLRTSVYF